MISYLENPRCKKNNPTPHYFKKVHTRLARLTRVGSGIPDSSHYTHNLNPDRVYLKPDIFGLPISVYPFLFQENYYLTLTFTRILLLFNYFFISILIKNLNPTAFFDMVMIFYLSFIITFGYNQILSI